MFGKLVAVLHAHIKSVADECFAESLISEEMYDAVLDLNKTKADMARKVLREVNKTISHQHRAWDKFLTILDNVSGCKQLVEEMRRNLLKPL